MQRAERIGLGVALVGHIALFTALSLGLFSSEETPPKPDPVQVSLIGEIAPVSTAPQLSDEAPAPAPADDMGDPLDAMADPLPQMDAPAPVTQTEPAPPRADPKPVPAPKPVAKPKPAPKPKAKAAPKPEPKKAAPEPKAAPKPAPKAEAKPEPTKSSGGSRANAARSRSFADNMRGSIGTSGKADNPPATAYSETTRRQIDVSIKGEIAPYWKRNVPSGVDVDQLRTVLRIKLNKNGSLAGTPQVVSQSGKSASNEPQQKLHIERAIKSVQQAAPFKLPAEYYDNWKSWDLTFRSDI
ncbi:cell envelope biogenesis protein TolA [Novosphingopyxis sp.]|uniref:cell envelope biogenesis protein TolA n=1 Tax=Novosphingopyxis sp. TaxID=2709690 RepID=UPI003B5A2B4E